MGELTLIDEVDAVLMAAYEKFPGGLNRHDIIKILNKQDIEVTGGLIEEITDHLTEKKYLKPYTQTVTIPAFVENAPHWAITFKGRMFHLNGGYNGKLSGLIAKTKATRNVYYLTYVIAFGGATAGIYYILEIWKYFHSCHCCH